MLNIALCSGSSRELDLLESMLEDYRSLRPQPEFACRRFLSLADLQERARAGERFPLCFVDLHIPRGGETPPAETVRRLEPDTLIVSLSTVLELAGWTIPAPLPAWPSPSAAGPSFRSWTRPSPESRSFSPAPWRCASREAPVTCPSTKSPWPVTTTTGSCSTWRTGKKYGATASGPPSRSSARRCSRTAPSSRWPPPASPISTTWTPSREEGF